ncbi:helix-turn-helix domain-containing protein [Haloglomus salinum]|jgi:predicted DNA binding protein|uniref:helix-turn-helix domain-containing protein n=1 Tax=Haloglomus salinum TaxID=2962673 RepID=UPI0020C953E0|nr:helix-turn-helix domain-containing protein [Haloglomus salinum]
MSLIAEISLSSPLMEATAGAVPETTFRMEDLQLVEDGPAKYLFWAEGGDLGRLDAALTVDPTVASFTCLTALSDRRLYRVSFTGEMKTRMTYLDAAANDIVYLEMRSTHQRTRIRARVPTRAALREYVETCQGKGIDLQVESLYRTDEGGAFPQYGLTEPQRAALIAAHEAGYFDPDRGATLADIAADLGISRQALAGRLRRGHRQLIEATLR